MKTREPNVAARDGRRRRTIVLAGAGLLAAFAVFSRAHEPEGPARSDRPTAVSAPGPGPAAGSTGHRLDPARALPAVSTTSSPAAPIAPAPADPPGQSARRLPASLLQLPTETGAAIVVDLTQNRMYVYRNKDGKPQLIADHFVAIGKNGSYKRREGDERTPVGVYFVTSWIPDQRLPELYGAGAFPVNYPNLWDRRLGRTGSGIWIHGMPRDQESRPARSSRGCLSLNNRDLLGIAPAIETGRTPVLISDQIEWATADEVEATRAEVTAALEAWRLAWESRSTDSYLAFYADDFRSGPMGLDAWSRHKRRVNSGKRFIEVTIDHVGAYAYPSEEGLVLLDFEQRYRSSNFTSSSRKRQFWRQTEAGWRIVHELNI